MKKLFSLAVLPFLTLCAYAQSGSLAPAPNVNAERDRIEAGRSRAEARFAEQEGRCYARFAVNDCLRDARSRRREVLDLLRQQELELNRIERERKASQQQERLQEKSSGSR